MTRMEVARVRLPIDVGVLISLCAALEDTWTELRLHTDIIDGIAWIIVTGFEVDG